MVLFQFIGNWLDPPNSGTYHMTLHMDMIGHERFSQFVMPGYMTFANIGQNLAELGGPCQFPKKLYYKTKPKIISVVYLNL